MILEGDVRCGVENAVAPNLFPVCPYLLQNMSDQRWEKKFFYPINNP